MKSSFIFFLFFALFCVLMEAFFSAFEMACVSLNKIRLEYNASKQNKRAQWLKKLLDKPSRLFGTTLITVNLVMQLGSEASRRFYESLSLNPDFAPISQIILVLIFGELAPLFAARKHAQHVSYLSVPIIYFISKILSPIIYLIDVIANFANYLFGQPKKNLFFMTRDEVKRVFEDEPYLTTSTENDKMNTIISNIFALGAKTAKEKMIELKKSLVLSSKTTAQEYRLLIQDSFFAYCFVYHNTSVNIVGIVYARDLLNMQPHDRIIEHANSPWFITGETKIIQVVKQFRQNNQPAAVVLNKKGQAIGILTLEQISDYIFSQDIVTVGRGSTSPHIEKRLDAEMSIEDFNKQFHAKLSYKNAVTLNDLIEQIVQHHPSEGDVIKIDRFAFTIEEVSLKGIKTLSVKTLY